MSAKTPNYGLNIRGPLSWQQDAARDGGTVWDHDANAQLVDAALAAIQAQIGGGSGIQVASVHVTAAQLLALGSSPVTIVAAAGAKKAVVPVFCVVRYNFVTTGYFVSAGAKLILTTPPLNTLTALLSVGQPDSSISRRVRRRS